MPAAGKTFAIGLVLAAAALAQPPDELSSTIAAVHNPPLAQQARIQGDVHLKLEAGIVKPVSGHPLLAPTAVESTKTFNSESNVDVTYHFVIDETATTMVPTWTTVKRGNAFERALLRAFGFKTEKTVASGCESVPPPNDVKVDGAFIEIWIYGKTFCLQTNTATQVAAS